MHPDAKVGIYIFFEGLRPIVRDCSVETFADSEANHPSIRRYRTDGKKVETEGPVC